MRYPHESARLAQLPDDAPLRVLCPIDLARRSHGAVHRAIALAGELEASLTLVHVAPADVGATALSSVAAPRDARVHAGEFVPTVAGIARESRTDLVVLDATESKRHEPMIDPGAEQLAQLARCPVLIVRRKSAAQYAAVLVAAEHSAVFDRVIRAASALRLLQGEPVAIIHGFESGHGGLLHGASLDAAAARRNLEEWERAAVRRLRRDLDDAGIVSDHFRMMFHPSRSRRQMQKEVRQLRPDLIVVATANLPALERVMRPAVGNDALRRNPCDILLGPL
ncbi:MAG TPA: universal stress protein [Steroidobacteraceae bacterium]|nr:universal stress protein [Steroidobacteraceae bacterium]